MADALAYCHGRAIPNAMVLHRDLKPDNVGEIYIYDWNDSANGSYLLILI
jgi:hypothetical protein